MLYLRRKSDCIMVYALFFAMFEPSFLPDVLHQVIKLIIIVLELFYIIVNDKNYKIFNIALLFGGCICISSFMAYQEHYISLMSFLYSVYYAVCLYCLYNVIGFFAKNGRINDFLQNLLDIVVLYCVITLITIVFPVSVDSTGLKIYAFGNKFSTSYLFLLLLGLFYTIHYTKIKKKLEWRAFYFFLVFMVVVFGRVVDCSTAVVAGAVFFLIYFLPERLRILLMNYKVVFVAIIISGSFPILMDKFIQNSFVQHIIVDILGENLTINFRNIIYRSYLFQLIEKSPIWGYGYSNTAMADMSGYAFGNAQNALFDVVLDYGFIGAIVLVIMVLYCYKMAAAAKNVEGISLYIYSLIVAGVVEITYGKFLFLVVFLLRWLCYVPRERSSKQGISKNT